MTSSTKAEVFELAQRRRLQIQQDRLILDHEDDFVLALMDDIKSASSADELSRLKSIVCRP